MFTRRSLIGAFWGSLAVAAVAGCAAKKGTPMRSNVALLDLTADAPAVGVAADSLRAFAWSLIADGAGNQLVSPSSFALALAMVGEGATGPAADAIDSLFGVSGDARSEALGGWKQSLEAFDALPERVDVNAPPEKPLAHLGAQVVVVDPDKNPVEQSFLDRLASHYGASAVGVGSWKELKPVLDAFAKRETAGLINESGIVPTAQIKLVVQDALLFAASWARYFENETVLEFNTSSGTVEADAIGGQLPVRSAEADGVQAIRIPFSERFAMDVLLPTGSLSAEKLQHITDALGRSEEAPRNVIMPKSDQTAKMDLATPLMNLGIVPGTYDGVFEGAVIDQFVQQTRLIVGVKGAVGAALTEVAMRETAAPPQIAPPFIVDRPYALQVVDAEHGWPLFLAKIEDPTKK